MQLFETINRIQCIHEMILKEMTGTPQEFAEHLHISRRQLYNILDEFKYLGAQIHYNRTRETFYYTNNFEIELKIK